MKNKDATDFASTKHKGLPTRVKKEIVHKLKQEYARLDNRHTTDTELEENFPKNWLQGRVGDQHTDLTTADREYDDEDSNFITRNSGQPDSEMEIEEGTINELLMLPTSTIVGLLPKSVFKSTDKRGQDEGKKLIRDLADTLNSFYTKHHLNLRIK